MPSSTSTLHLTDLPPSTLLSLDFSSFTLPKPLKANSTQSLIIHSIPQGPHHLFVSPPTSLLRHGTWILTPPSSDLHYTWDSESLSLVPTDSTTLATGNEVKPVEMVYKQRLSSGEEVEGSDADAEWRAVTSLITPNTLERIFANQLWGCSSLAGAQDWEAGVASDAPPPLEEEGDSDETLYYASIDLKQTWPTGAIGRERTDNARDRSWRLGDVTSKLGSGEVGRKELIAEWEVSFVHAVLLGNYASGEHWRVILELVVTSFNAACDTATWGGFYKTFLRSFRGMLAILHGGLTGDNCIIEVDENMQTRLRKFGAGLREAVDEDEGNAGLKEVWKEWQQFKLWCEGEMEWVLEKEGMVRRGKFMNEEGDLVDVVEEGVEEEEEKGEWAPVVVEMEVEREGAGKREEEEEGLGDEVWDDEEGDPRY